MDKYVIYNDQTGFLMGKTEENPLTFNECIEYLLTYHSIDHTKEELKEIEKSYRKHNSYAKISIILEKEFYFGDY